jgi:hypothetical protein
MTAERDDGNRQPATYFHEHVTRTIGVLDLKAQIFMGFAAASLTYEMRDLETLKNITEIVGMYETATTFYENAAVAKLITGVCSAVALIVSFLLAVMCVMPRSGPNNRSVIYFQGIAGHDSAQDYTDHVSDLTPRQYTDAVLMDIYYLSRIAALKAWYVKLTTYGFVIGVALLIATQVLAALSVPPRTKGSVGNETGARFEHSYTAPAS